MSPYIFFQKDPALFLCCHSSANLNVMQFLSTGGSQPSLTNMMRSTLRNRTLINSIASMICPSLVSIIVQEHVFLKLECRANSYIILSLLQSHTMKASPHTLLALCIHTSIIYQKNIAEYSLLVLMQYQRSPWLLSEVKIQSSFTCLH